MRLGLVIGLTLLTGALAEAKGFSKKCQDHELMYCLNDKSGQCEEIYVPDEIASEACNRVAQKIIRRTCGGTYRGLLFGSRETCDQVLSQPQ